MKEINLLDLYKAGDPMCDIRFGDHGVVIKVSKKSVTFKLKDATEKVTFHTLDGIEDFYVSHPVIKSK